MKSYTTVQGDTFDVIALSVYGREALIAPLLEANPRYAEFMVFPAGIALNVPEIGEPVTTADDLPPWRRE